MRTKYAGPQVRWSLSSSECFLLEHVDFIGIVSLLRLHFVFTHTVIGEVHFPCSSVALELESKGSVAENMGDNPWYKVCGN